MKVELTAWMNEMRRLADALDLPVSRIGFEQTSATWRAYLDSSRGGVDSTAQSAQAAADGALRDLRTRVKERLVERRKEIEKLEAASKGTLRIVEKNK